MTVATIYQPGFARTQQRSRWWRDKDGAWATTVSDITEPVTVPWNLEAVLESGVTVDSATFEDQGTASSGTSVSSATATITFTLTGYGDCKVTATLSSGGPIVQRFRVYPVTVASGSSDYGNR